MTSIKSYEEALTYIHTRSRFGSQLGLERMRDLLMRIGNPQENLKFIHIAGTNGKGSVANLCSNILQEAGYCVGLFTSPFIIDFRERFQTNGILIERKTLLDIVRFILPHVINMEKQNLIVTEFELVTAIGMEYFRRMGCDIVCLEVGLGGQFDATNAINSALVSVITAISLDHTSILGNTIEKIASEKAGIIKENSTVITYPLQPVEATAILMEQCAKTHSTLLIPSANDVRILRCNEKGSRFLYRDVEYGISLAGEHQVYNAITVLSIMEVLIQKGFRIRPVDIRTGLSTTTVPARFNIITNKPLVVLDGAHNLQAIHALTATLKKMPQKKVFLFGMMADKDSECSIAALAEIAAAMVTVTVDCPRAADAIALAKTAQKYCKQAVASNDYADAIQKAFSYMDNDTMLIVCGSFYFVGDMKLQIKRYIRSTK